MGYEDVKVDDRRGVNKGALDRNLRLSVFAAVSSFRDSFKETLGSEPIVESDKPYEFKISTFGAGEYNLVGAFSMQELPGCCGVAVCYHASVSTKFQKKGLGRLFLKVREKAAIFAGYTMGLATVIDTNKAERKILEEAGWISVVGFKNTRTNNNVMTFYKMFSK